MRTRVRFEPDQHKYFVQDREIPSVTIILKNLGLIDDRFFTEESRRIGTAVHELTELIDLGLKPSPPIALQGYINAYQAFKKSNSTLRVKEIEKVLYQSFLSYCGKLDRVFVDEETGEEVIIDIKTGVPLRCHQLQCTAYAIAYKNKKARIGGLHLYPDGKYKYKEFDRVNGLWHSCMAVYNFKERR